MQLGKQKEKESVKMGEIERPFGELSSPSALPKERILLRRLADNYYGACLARVMEGIIHNLNAPLQVLYIRSEQLEQNLEQLLDAVRSKDLSEVEDLATGMQKSIKSISTSLDDLNAQVRYLSSDLIVERCSEIGDVNLNQVIDECLFLLNANMFFKHSVKKTINLDDALPVIRGRKSDFCIIVLTLVQNALEAMADTQDKHLAIETSSEENKAIIRVVDSGCGISEQARDHLGEVCFTTKTGAGKSGEPDKHTGLGLSLVSVLLEDYQGKIGCENVPGRTTFTVQIPCPANSSDGSTCNRLRGDVV